MMRLNQVPASCAALDPAEVARTLAAESGSVTVTARRLGVPPGDLRRMVASSSLADIVYEQLEQDLDAAMAVVLSALAGDDKAARLQAAHILLSRTDAGRARGWGGRSAPSEEHLR